MSDDRTIPRDQVTRLLASALGQEKSEEVVGTAARAHGIAGLAFSPDEVREIFQSLSRSEGLVGVVARFAISRGDVEALVAEAPLSNRQPSLRPEPKAVAVDLVPLLAPALGTEKARDATEASATKLGIDLTQLTREQALLLLDDMAATDGMVGVVARFAKARLLLG